MKKKTLIVVVALFICVMAVGCTAPASDFHYWNAYENGEFIGVSIGNYQGSDTVIVIPAKIDRKKVASIWDSAFSGCSSLTSITIPDSVTSIGERAFSGCSSLTSITIPDSVTSIRDRTFSDCSSLTSITIPDSVTSIGRWAFVGCTSLTSITIPNSVTNIEESAFNVCNNLKTITVKKGSYAESWAKDNGYGVIYY